MLNWSVDDVGMFRLYLKCHQRKMSGNCFESLHFKCFHLIPSSQSVSSDAFVTDSSDETVWEHNKLDSILDNEDYHTGMRKGIVKI